MFALAIATSLIHGLAMISMTLFTFSDTKHQSKKVANTNAIVHYEWAQNRQKERMCNLPENGLGDEKQKGPFTVSDCVCMSNLLL